MSEILIFFATQTGNAETAAEMIRDHLKSQGLTATVENIAKLPIERFLKESVIIGVASTWGDGEPPDDAIDFWAEVEKLPPLVMSHSHFGIYALGDSCYDEFCAFGKKLDEAFERLGGHRLITRQECDIDFEDDVVPWTNGLIEALQSVSAPTL